MIKKIAKLFNFNIFVGIVGVIGTLYTIISHYQKNEPNLRYEILSDINVLDFNVDLGKLEVLYDSTNLKKTKENLRIYTVKVINNGSKDILKDSYDHNIAIGLKINSGKFIEIPELIQSSNDYIKQNIDLYKLSNERITFSKIILESEQYFVLKFLVLHKENSIPSFNSFGKIAGQQSIDIVKSENIKDDRSFFEESFSGSIGVLFFRLLYNLIFLIVLLRIIVYIVEKLSNINTKKRKKKLVAKFKKSDGYIYSKTHDVLFSTYIDSNFDIENLRQISSFLGDQERLALFENKIIEIQSTSGSDLANLSFYPEFDTYLIMKESLIRDGYIYFDNDTVKVNASLENALNQFIAYFDLKNNSSSLYK